MRELPILFSTPMVQAILNTKPNAWPPEPIDPNKPYKWQTRRVIKPQPDSVRVSVFCKSGLETRHGYEIKCPYEVGMRLYVKENAWIWCQKVRDGWTLTGKPKYRYIPVGEHVVYQADHPGKPENRIDDNPEHDWRMKVARFMPHWASRITLDVVSRRVERVQEITVEDVMAEGLPDVDNELENPDPTTHESIRNWNLSWAQWVFQELWDKINAKRGFGWDANPWCWVVEFKRVEGGSHETAI
jgi:hypothetical protein